MNKILNINLGGIPFTIDINAYTHLEKYLDAIRRHFSDSESCDEIIHDIEVRMGELFQESMKGSSIISNKELDEVIQIMGTPEDFGAESVEDDYEPTEESRKNYTSRAKKKNSGKRLFRDGDDKVVAGLCSGIAAYFGVNDPLWIRVAFVILLFSGLSPIIYILLWVIVPVARTSSEKLSMRGENINISNIAKTVEEEITELSKRISKIGKDLSSKKK
ncbi:MAG: PspC domain-containing protein [Saprospiraceae bacterium]